MSKVIITVRKGAIIHIASTNPTDLFAIIDEDAQELDPAGVPVYEVRVTSHDSHIDESYATAQVAYGEPADIKANHTLRQRGFFEPFVSATEPAGFESLRHQQLRAHAEAGKFEEEDPDFTVARDDEGRDRDGNRRPRILIISGEVIIEEYIYDWPTGEEDADHDEEIMRELETV
jgi:hypothetical protein